MPKIDTPVKRLMQERPQDWIAYLLPGHAENPYRIVNPEKVPKAQSRLDSLWQIGEEPDHFFLHLEPQGYLDTAFPARSCATGQIPGSIPCPRAREHLPYARWPCFYMPNTTTRQTT